MEQEEIDIDDYPFWLGKDLIRGRLPWEEGLQINFAEFSKKYTIHDSCWSGLYFDVPNCASVTLTIQWDTHWLPDSIVLSNPDVYLFIKIEQVQ